MRRNNGRPSDPAQSILNGIVKFSVCLYRCGIGVCCDSTNCPRALSSTATENTPHLISTKNIFAIFLAPDVQSAPVPVSKLSLGHSDNLECSRRLIFTLSVRMRFQTQIS